jgi:DNA-binding GntR family transcriptional regulator
MCIRRPVGWTWNQVGRRAIKWDDRSTRFSASPHFTRQALHEPERLGIAVREKNKGVSVRVSTPAEVRQIYDVRELLQRQAALRISLPAQPALIAELERLQDDYLRFLQARDFGALHDANDAFHITMLSARGNQYLVQSIQHYMLLSLPVRSPARQGRAH